MITTITLKQEVISSVDKKTGMAVVTCHFNWANFTNPKRNLHRFIRYMKAQNVPLYGIELSLTDEFETSGIEGWTQIRVNWSNVCFQKEALINLLVNKHVPNSYRKIAWIDHDVFFTNQNWYNDAVIALDYVNVIQLFEKAVWTASDGKVIETSPAMVIPRPNTNSWSGHPGFALAAKRELWNHGGLFEKTPVGNGDTVFLYSIFRIPLSNTVKLGMGVLNTEHEKIVRIWEQGVNSFINRSIGYIKGDCVHEWHGDKKHRQYQDRKCYLEGFDITKVIINDIGILELTSDLSLEFLKGMMDYFKSRKEDG